MPFFRSSTCSTFFMIRIMASTQGYIYEFNNEGDLLFVFGGGDDEITYMVPAEFTTILVGRKSWVLPYRACSGFP